MRTAGFAASGQQHAGQPVVNQSAAALQRLRGPRQQRSE